MRAAAAIVTGPRPDYKPAMSKPRPGHRAPRHGGGNPHPPRTPADRRSGALHIYGIHPVLAALANPHRHVRRLLATANGLARLIAADATVPAALEEVMPRDLDRLIGGDAVHQGVAAEVEPLDPLPIAMLGTADLVVVLDQVTDPHNVGAIMRSAVAFGADAIITTGRHSPAETGVLAKAASGALDQLAHVEVPNLARALGELADLGFTRIGLDSEADATIDQAMAGDRIALVLGAEGKGLRRLTRDTCDRLARLPTVGPIASLNVSNAAVLALYLARRHLGAATS